MAPAQPFVRYRVQLNTSTGWLLLADPHRRRLTPSHTSRLLEKPLTKTNYFRFPFAAVCVDARVVGNLTTQETVGIDHVVTSTCSRSDYCIVVCSAVSRRSRTCWTTSVLLTSTGSSATWRWHCRGWDGARLMLRGALVQWCTRCRGSLGDTQGMTGEYKVEQKQGDKHGCWWR
jgi:hypothetical protein